MWWLFGIILLFCAVVFRGAPYVPSRKRGLEQAFSKLYPLSGKDLLVDIGSGDGVVLREAAKRGARAIGYELNPLLVAISWLVSRRYRKLIKVRLSDFWLVSFPPETTVIYTFGESRDIVKMYRKVEREATKLKKPLYFISFGFAVPDVDSEKFESGFYLYRVTPLQP